MQKHGGFMFYPFLILLLLFFTSCDPGTEEEQQQNGRFSPNTQRLMNFLEDVYGDYIISGQMDTSWTTNSTMDMVTRVFDDTGKYPALKGFDLIQLPYSNNPFHAGKEQIDEAIDWWEGKNRRNGTPAQKLLTDKPDIHGIIAICWHWRVPGWRSGNTGSSSMEFYTNQTNFRIPWKDGRLDTDSANFKNTIIADLDKVADLLKLLQDKDIPVLWRPMHEAAGNWQPSSQQVGWFWWGASGPDPYIALWEFMYDYLTVEKKLNNLIWVWNAQHTLWAPQPYTVDIVSYDYYPWPRNTPATAQNYNSQKSTFDQVAGWVADGTSRMVAMSENGGIPDPVKCKQDNAMWSWFMVWNDSGAVGVDNQDNFWTGEFVNTQVHKDYVYNHELVLTLDELPDLTKYRLK